MNCRIAAGYEFALEQTRTRLRPLLDHLHSVEPEGFYFSALSINGVYRAGFLEPSLVSGVAAVGVLLRHLQSLQSVFLQHAQSQLVSFEPFPDCGNPYQEEFVPGAVIYGTGRSLYSKLLMPTIAEITNLGLPDEKATSCNQRLLPQRKLEELVGKRD